MTSKELIGWKLMPRVDSFRSGGSKPLSNHSLMPDPGVISSSSASKSIYSKSKKSTLSLPEAVPMESPEAQSGQHSNQAPRAEEVLLSTVITSIQYSQLTLTKIKKLDRHGCIYEAKQITNESLFEVRVYSFDHKNSAEKQYVRRNCRDWRRRRRFLDSHQEKGFTFLILRHPEPTAASLSARETTKPSPPISEKQEASKTADALTQIAKDPASDLVELAPQTPSLGFTLSNIAQMSASLKKNLWNWKSEWDWTYPHGWSRKLVIYEEGTRREAICWPDFDGDFSRAVPNRIFSSEQLSHPNMRKSIKTTSTIEVLPAKMNDKPVMCVSRPKIQVLLGVWFSADTLRTDTRLRKHMDSIGFVPLSIIASHDEQSLDIDVLRSVCEVHEDFLYAKDVHGTELMRLREGWEEWVLPVAERERKVTYRTYRKRIQAGSKSVLNSGRS